MSHRKNKREKYKVEVLFSGMNHLSDEGITDEKNNVTVNQILSPLG